MFKWCVLSVALLVAACDPANAQEQVVPDTNGYYELMCVPLPVFDDFQSRKGLKVVQTFIGGNGHQRWSMWNDETQWLLTLEVAGSPNLCMVDHGLLEK